MGNSTSQHPCLNKSTKELSTFCLACENGDLGYVRQILPTLTFDQINQIESNGNTALHAASSRGQIEVVRLLLEHGCCRTIVNSHGFTAYEEARHEDIKVLFKRDPSADHMTEPFQHRRILPPMDVTMHRNSHYLHEYQSSEEADSAKLMFRILNASFLERQLIKKKLETSTIENFMEVIDEIKAKAKICPTDFDLYYNRFLTERHIESLITLFTLQQPPAYTTLRKDAGSFTILMYLHLSKLKQRAFESITYRGSGISEEDLQQYRWALEHKGTVEIRTFLSTTLRQEVANIFGEKNPYQATFIFKFPKACVTAINTCRLSEKLPCISHFPDEQEILVFPYTLFEVTNIAVTDSDGRYLIMLKNIEIPKRTLTSFVLERERKENSNGLWET